MNSAGSVVPAGAPAHPFVPPISDTPKTGSPRARALGHPYALSFDEARAALCISRATAYRRVQDGTLRVVKLGRRTLVPASEITRILGIDTPNA